MTAPRSTKGPSIWNRTFICLICVNFFQIMGQMMMNTIMPLYARDLGAQATLIGFVVGSFAISALITRPFASPAFDSFRKKPFMYICLIIMSVSCFLYGFADSIPFLIIVRMIHGAALGNAASLALSLVTESLPIERMASGISIYSLAQALCQAVGPAAGLYLIDVIGYAWTFRVSGLSLLIACALFVLVKEKKRDNRPPYQLKLDRMFAKGAIVPAILLCIVSSANTAIMSFIAIYADLRDVSSIGLFFTVQACCLFATRPLFGKVADRLGYVAVIIPALVVYGVSFVILANATSLWMFLVAAVVCSFGYGSCQPLMQALAMASVPRTRSGAASSTNYTGADIAQLVGPASAGALAEYFTAQTGSEVTGYADMYLSIIVIVAAAIVFLAIMRKFVQRNIEAANKANIEASMA